MVGTLVSVSMAHGAAISAIHIDGHGNLFTGDRRGWIAGWDRFGCAWRYRAHRRGVSAIIGVPGCVDDSGTGDSRCAAHLVSGGFDGTLVAVDAVGSVDTRPLARFRRGVSSIDLDRNGRRVAAASLRGDLWCAALDGQKADRARFGERGPAFVRFAAEGELLYAWGGRGRVEMRSPDGLREIARAGVPEFMTFDVMPAGSGAAVVLGYDNQLRHFLVSPWVLLGSIRLPLEGRCSILACAGESVWLYGAEQICEVSLRAMRVVRSVPFPGMSAAALAPEPGLLAIGYRTGELQLWQFREPTVAKN